jgi:hypothetical protein
MCFSVIVSWTNGSQPTGKWLGAGERLVRLGVEASVELLDGVVELPGQP